MSNLKTPRVTVLLEQPGSSELIEIIVQTDNRDAIQWDVTRGRRDWPKGSEAPMLWLTFLAWHAMRRTGSLPDPALSIDDFMQRCVQVGKPDGDDDTAEAGGGDPTQRDLTPA